MALPDVEEVNAHDEVHPQHTIKQPKGSVVNELPELLRNLIILQDGLVGWRKSKLYRYNNTLKNRLVCGIRDT